MSQTHDSGYFYKHHFPKIDELVMVRIKSISDTGILCDLLEYNNIEGFLSLTEVSRRKLHALGRVIKINDKHVLHVTNIDPEKHYIDLSKKFITEEEKNEGLEKYRNGKFINNITRRIADTVKINFDTLYDIYITPLYENEKYKYPVDALKSLVVDKKKIWENCPNTNENVIAEFIKLLEHKINLTYHKIEATIELTCFSENGIDDIKLALDKGSEIGGTDISIQLISSPLYLCWTNSIDEQKGINLVNKVIETISQTIYSRKGECIVKIKPHKLDT